MKQHVLLSSPVLINNQVTDFFSRSISRNTPTCTSNHKDLSDHRKNWISSSSPFKPSKYVSTHPNKIFGLLFNYTPKWDPSLIQCLSFRLKCLLSKLFHIEFVWRLGSIIIKYLLTNILCILLKSKNFIQPWREAERFTYIETLYDYNHN